VWLVGLPAERRKGCRFNFLNRDLRADSGAAFKNGGTSVNLALLSKTCTTTARAACALALAPAVCRLTACPATTPSTAYC